MACGWSGRGGREGNYLLGERPLHGVARYSPSTGTEASHCSQWSRGIAPVVLTVAVLMLPECFEHSFHRQDRNGGIARERCNASETVQRTFRMYTL